MSTKGRKQSVYESERIRVLLDNPVELQTLIHQAVTERVFKKHECAAVIAEASNLMKRLDNTGRYRALNRFCRAVSNALTHG